MLDVSVATSKRPATMTKFFLQSKTELAIKATRNKIPLMTRELITYASYLYMSLNHVGV